MQFEPKTAELIQTGATAALILDAVQLMAAECVESVLKRIDHCEQTGTMTPTAALQFVAEIAAYRRIVLRIAHKAETGRRMKDVMNG